MSVPSDRIWHRHNFFYADLPMRSDPVVLTSDRKFSENSCREDQKDAKQDERDSWQATLDQLYIYIQLSSIKDWHFTVVLLACRRRKHCRTPSCPSASSSHLVSNHFMAESCGALQEICAWRLCLPYVNL